MPADRYCDAPYKGRPGAARCELVLLHGGEHYVFDNRPNGLTWSTEPGERCWFKDCASIANESGRCSLHERDERAQD